MAKRKHRPTYAWAMGNKRQKAKIRRWLASGCGCFLCLPEDRRQKIRERDERRASG